MKKLKNIIQVLLAAAVLSACETNNVFDDLGKSDGSIVSNVYMEALAPKLQAGLTRELEVQYWSLDDDFAYLGLWDYVSVYQVFEVTVSGVVYTAEVQDEFQDWQEYQQYSFDFAHWTPELSAYYRIVEYEIDQQYDAVTLDNGDITFSEFSAQLPEDFEADIYNYYSTNLTRSTLNDLMIDNAVMTQIEFDSHYGDNGFLTTEGKVAVVAGLAEIGMETLVGDGYSLGNEYQITVAFRATNGTQKSNESRRTFVVF
ncbi:MAG: hypothetical protein ABJ004_06930 [Cyclobacteriaceae bacterium]